MAEIKIKLTDSQVDALAKSHGHTEEQEKAGESALQYLVNIFTDQFTEKADQYIKENKK